MPHHTQRNGSRKRSRCSVRKYWRMPLILQTWLCRIIICSHHWATLSLNNASLSTKMYENGWITGLIRFKRRTVLLAWHSLPSGEVGKMYIQPTLRPERNDFKKSATERVKIIKSVQRELHEKKDANMWIILRISRSFQSILFGWNFFQCYLIAEKKLYCIISSV